MGRVVATLHMEDVPKVEAHNVPKVEAPGRSQRVKRSNITDDCKSL
jgi:hypothetical protein